MTHISPEPEHSCIGGGYSHRFGCLVNLQHENHGHFSMRNDRQLADTPSNCRFGADFRGLGVNLRFCVGTHGHAPVLQCRIIFKFHIRCLGLCRYLLCHPHLRSVRSLPIPRPTGVIEEEHVRITKAGSQRQDAKTGYKRRITNPGSNLKDRKVTAGTEEILELRPDKGSGG